MTQAQIIIRNGGVTLVTTNVDGSKGEKYWSTFRHSRASALEQAFSTLNRFHPNIDFIISDQRTLKPLPDPEDNRVDLNKAA